MIKGVNGNDTAQNGDLSAKNKKANSTSATAAVAAIGGASLGHFVSSLKYDKYIKEAQAVIDKPEVLKSNYVKALGDYAKDVPEAHIDKTINRFLGDYKTVITKFNKAKLKYTAAGAAIAVVLYTGGKAIFGKKED